MFIIVAKYCAKAVWRDDRRRVLDSMREHGLFSVQRLGEYVACWWCVPPFPSSLSLPPPSPIHHHLFARSSCLLGGMSVDWTDCVVCHVWQAIREILPHPRARGDYDGHAGVLEEDGGVDEGFVGGGIV